MKKQLLNLAKIILPLALGVGLIVYFLQSFSEEELVDIYRAFLEADYRWILFSLVFAVLSHLSRAYRWKFMLEPLGFKPKFTNSILAVLVGYLVNLAIPRAGEISRATVMTNYEKIPFEKAFGTIVAERNCRFDNYDCFLILGALFSIRCNWLLFGRKVGEL